MSIGFVNKSSTVNSSSTTTTVVSTPSGLSGAGNQRLIAFVGVIGTGNVITDPAGGTWVKLAEFAPETNFKTAVYYRNVTGSEAGSYTWTWSVGGRNFGHIVAYSGVDLTVPPTLASVAGTADSAGPHAAPSVAVADGGWLITGVAARQSPGTAGAVTWTVSDGADSERYDVTAVNTGTGAQLPTAVYDSNRALTAAGGGGGGSSLPAGAAPLNKYNEIFAAPRGTMLVGQTNAIDFIEDWRNRIAGLDWMRVFPNSGMPPPWTDARIEFIRDFGGQVFLSTKVDGDNAKIDEIIAHLNAMPTWIKNHANPNHFVWITDRHEPEGDIPAATYIANITEYINKIKAGLTAPVLARVKVGPVLTRQWTENTAGRTYKTHDPGIGDFLGIDMYQNSWNYPYTDPATFLSKVKAYRYDGKAVGLSTDLRPRIFPELGAIGHPNDTDGTLRAAWMQNIHDILKTWTTAMNGWPFGGWIWWNEQGKSGDSVAGIGTRRWFQLDRIHNGEPYTYYDSVQKKNVTDPIGGWDYLPVIGSGGGGGGGGTTPTARQVTASVLVNSTHVWAVALAPTAGSGAGNAWSNCGVPIR